MSKTKKLVMLIASAIIIGFIGKALILDEAVTSYLFTFFFVGAGLAYLRLFINAMIAKMKGKNIFVKIGFFAVLLGIGMTKKFKNLQPTEQMLQPYLNMFLLLRGIRLVNVKVMC